ncbi:MAG: hypothetical protein E7496_08140, partial [Ruminococcus sp.]|nr:hypothetical protein [Ruminococcus sp.]
MLLITFMQNEYINTTVLPDVKKGRYQVNHSISNLTEEIYINGIDGQWVINSGEEYEIQNKDAQKIETLVLQDNDFIMLKVHDQICTM